MILSHELIHLISCYLTMETKFYLYFSDLNFWKKSARKIFAVDKDGVLEQSEGVKKETIGR